MTDEKIEFVIKMALPSARHPRGGFWVLSTHKNPVIRHTHFCETAEKAISMRDACIAQFCK